jgi:hypothetical protein
MADLETRIREQLGRVSVPAGDLDRVVGRSRVRRLRRWAGVSMLTAIAAAGITLPLWLLLPRGVPPSLSGDEGGDVRLSAVAPPGWETRTVSWEYGNALQAANTALGDTVAEPSVDDVTLSDARAQLGPDEVAVVALDTTQQIIPDDVDVGEARAWRWADFPPVEAPPALEVGDFSTDASQEGQAVEPDHAFARIQFRLEGMAIDLWVNFGTSPPPPQLLAEVNSLLSSFDVVPAEAPPAPSGDTRRFADGDDGVAVTIPSGWTYHEDPSGPDDPKTLFAFGSWPFEEGGDCAPTAAQAALPPAGALVWVMEYLGQPDLAVDIGPRPGSFRFDEETLATYECSLVPSYMFRFRGPSGRAFQAHIALGPAVTDETRRLVQFAVRSIEILTPHPDGCPEGGPWSHPACPEQAWVREVVDRAGYEVVGDTGSALIIDAGGIEFSMHTTSVADDPVNQSFEERIWEREGYRLHGTADEIPSYTDGIRDIWTVHGLHVWITSAEPEPDPVPLDILEALVRISVFVRFESGFQPECGSVSLAGEEYGAEFTPVAGAPGSVVTVAGTTLRGEDGRYTPADRVEVWWNERWPVEGLPAPLGERMRLAVQDISGRCHFAVRFLVPDVAPGRYPLVVHAYHPGEYGAIGWTAFDVAG